MKVMGITGASGFIGWHLRVLLLRQGIINPTLIDEKNFTDKKSLAKKIGQCDVVVHLAALNRGDDRQVYATNIGLTSQLIQACETANATPHVIFASSTHRAKNTAYGKSKKASERILRTWAKKHKAIVTNLILPNVFGEYGKPFYNSVVATFCYQLARSEQPTILSDSMVEFIHAQEVAKIIFDFIKKPRNVDFRVWGKKIKVSNLLAVLAKMRDAYVGNTIPRFEQPFERNLFNTLRSFFLTATDFFPKTFELKSDERGYLFEMLKHHSTGQFFASFTKSGVTRGNHYHTRKFERFAVIQGRAEIALRRLLTDKIIKFKVSGKQPVFVDMPTFYVHSIKNIGKEDLITLFWSDEIFNPTDTDTYQEKV